MRTLAAFILIWLIGLCAAQAQSTYEPLQDRQAYLKAVYATPEETTGFKPAYHDASEEDTARQRVPIYTIHVTGGGNGGYASYGIERVTPVERKDSYMVHMWAVKVGFGAAGGMIFSDSYPMIPVQATYNIGWKAIFLEGGMGASFIIDDQTQLYMPLGIRLLADDSLITLKVFRGILIKLRYMKIYLMKHYRNDATFANEEDRSSRALTPFRPSPLANVAP